MSSLLILGDTSGSVLVQAPAVAGSTVINVAAQSGTLNVGGPAFSATMSANQNISSGVSTKIVFDTKEYDTANAFNTTNYRFTPQVAGYYQVTGAMYPNSTTSFTAVIIYKNGSNYKAVQSTGANVGPVITSLVYLNGSTDYIELYGYISGSSPQIYAASQYTFFQAFLARTA